MGNHLDVCPAARPGGSAPPSSQPALPCRLRARILLAVLAAAAGSSGNLHADPAAGAAPATAVANDAEVDMPLWAYGVLTAPRPGDTAKPQSAPGPRFNPDIPRDEQLKPLHIAGSDRSYTMVELGDWQHVADWFPEQHGPVPPVITRGPKRLGEQTRACGFCHRIEGGGRPENASVFGLPVAYFLRQLDDFRSGRRHSSDPRKANLPTMAALARAISDDEARAAAAFWSRQSGGPHVRVIETDRVPPVRLHGNLFVATAGERSEPIAGRIVEVPEDLEREGRYDDPRSGFIAYVPVGSIARGRALATRGSAADATATSPAATIACITCHGVGLRGLGEAPPLAGRSPSYLVRQLYDFHTGARNGTMAVLMKPVVAHLTTAQMTDVAAYVATLPRRDADLPPAR